MKPIAKSTGERALQHRLAWLSGAAVLALLSCHPASAQEAAQVAVSPQPTAEPAASDTTEVIVTARRRSENLTAIPEQVSVLTSAAIAEKGTKSIQDVSASMTNFSVVKTQNPGTIFLNLRGIGQYRNSEAPVAIVIDGVQLASTDAITQDLYDIQQIEVLKGPQGALFGRNASAGAINIVTKKPDNMFDGSLEGTYANGDDVRVRAMVSGPIIRDKLFARLSASASQFAGVIDNVTTGRSADFSRDANLRFRAIAQLSDTLSLDFRASYSKLHAGSSYFAPIIDKDGFALNGVANRFDFPVQTDTEGKDNRVLKDVALKISKDYSGLTLTSITDVLNTRETFFQDLDFTAAPVIDFGQGRSVKAWSEELRLTSSGEGRLKWMAGVYYLDSTRQIDTNVFISGANIGAYNSAAFNNGTLSLSTFDFGDSTNIHAVDLSVSERSRNSAVFGNIDYKITDSLNLTIGARYDEDRRRQIDLHSHAVLYKTFGLLQPKIELSYRPVTTFNLYASWGRGFRSGGFNQTGTVSASYGAEEVATGEIGFKSEWNNRHLSVNGAVFHTDFVNRQDFIFIQGVQTILDIPKARINGAELEVRYHTANGFDLYASEGLLDTRIQANPLGLDPTITGLPANFDFIGKKIPLAYGRSFAAGLRYSHPVGDTADFIANVDYTSRGDMAWELANQDKQDTVNLVNLHLTLKTDTVSISLWADNLLDTRYWQEFVSREFSALTTDLGFPASPRRFGVTVSSRF